MFRTSLLFPIILMRLVFHLSLMFGLCFQFLVGWPALLPNRVHFFDVSVRTQDLLFSLHLVKTLTRRSLEMNMLRRGTNLNVSLRTSVFPWNLFRNLAYGAYLG